MQAVPIKAARPKALPHRQHGSCDKMRGKKHQKPAADRASPRPVLEFPSADRSQLQNPGCGALKTATSRWVLACISWVLACITGPLTSSGALTLGPRALLELPWYLGKIANGHAAVRRQLLRAIRVLPTIRALPPIRALPTTVKATFPERDDCGLILAPVGCFVGFVA
jgi:hypothetical protein